MAQHESGQYFIAFSTIDRQKQADAASRQHAVLGQGTPAHTTSDVNPRQLDKPKGPRSPGPVPTKPPPMRQADHPSSPFTVAYKTTIPAAPKTGERAEPSSNDNSVLSSRIPASVIYNSAQNQHIMSETTDNNNMTGKSSGVSSTQEDDYATIQGNNGAWAVDESGINTASSSNIESIMTLDTKMSTGVDSSDTRGGASVVEEAPRDVVQDVIYSAVEKRISFHNDAIPDTQDPDLSENPPPIPLKSPDAFVDHEHIQEESQNTEDVDTGVSARIRHEADMVKDDQEYYASIDSTAIVQEAESVHVQLRKKAQKIQQEHYESVVLSESGEPMQQNVFDRIHSQANRLMEQDIYETIDREGTHVASTKVSPYEAPESIVSQTANKDDMKSQDEVAAASMSNTELPQELKPRAAGEALRPPQNFLPKGYQFSGKHNVFIHQCDVLKMFVNAVVIGTDEHLSHSHGLAGAVSRAAGKDFDKECKKFTKKHGFIKIPNVGVTKAGKMPCTKVIHAVEPKWKEGHESEMTFLLQKTFENILEICGKEDIYSVAIPPLLSGSSGVPNEVVVGSLKHALLTISARSTEGKYTNPRNIHIVDIKPDLLLQLVEKLNEYQQGMEAGKIRIDEITEEGVHWMIKDIASSHKDGNKKKFAASIKDPRSHGSVPAAYLVANTADSGADRKRTTEFTKL